MKQLLRNLAIVSLVFAIGVILFLACITMGIALPTIVNRLTRPKVHEVTTPLETAVVQDLCQKLALPENDPLCQPGAVVYAPDFFPAVRASFKCGITTYDDVQAKLGRYLYERDPLVTQADGTSYFRCWYDFRGDRVFPVVFTFTREGVLERLSATVGDD